MSQIHFSKKRPPITVANGDNLMRALLEAGIPVASSCNGEGICGKCKVRIVSGAENLSPTSEDELFLMTKNRISKDHRISCQTKVQGDATIDASYW